MADKIVECRIPNSVLDQAAIHPDVVAGLGRQMEQQQVLISLQAQVRNIDTDNPGPEGYNLLFQFIHAYNEYYRATRELFEAELAIYVAWGCPMPDIPDWLTAL